MRYQCMARFGKDSAKPIENLREIVGEILTASEMLSYYWTERARSNEPDKKKLTDEIRQYESVIWHRGSKDSIVPKLEKIISDAENLFRRILEPSIKGKIAMGLRLTHWFEWVFGVITMTTITVITSLNFLSGFSRWALIAGLLVFFIASVIVQFDNAGWFGHRRR